MHWERACDTDVLSVTECGAGGYTEQVHESRQARVAIMVARAFNLKLSGKILLSLSHNSEKNANACAVASVLQVQVRHGHGHGGKFFRQCPTRSCQCIGAGPGTRLGSSPRLHRSQDEKSPLLSI